MLLWLLILREDSREDFSVKLQQEQPLDLLDIYLFNEFGVDLINVPHRLAHLLVQVLQDLLRVWWHFLESVISQLHLTLQDRYKLRKFLNLVQGGLQFVVSRVKLRIKLRASLIHHCLSLCKLYLGCFLIEFFLKSWYFCSIVLQLPLSFNRQLLLAHTDVLHNRVKLLNSVLVFAIELWKQ